MSKDVINVDGKDVIVREDTARAFRGSHWAMISIIAFIAIAAIMMAVFFARSAMDGKIESPSQASNANSTR